MNIALLPSAFHPHFGGVEELTRQLAHQLVVEGHKPLIVTNRWPKDLPEAEEFESLPIRRYVFRVPERTWKQMGGSLLFGPATLNQLCKDLRAFGAEVIHVQCVSSNAYYAVQAKRRLKIPLVVTLQGELTMDANRLFERSNFARDMLRQVLTEADAITACSARTLADAEEFYGQSLSAKSRVIFNGASAVDFETAKPYCHSRPYLFAIGRLVPQKGFDVLLNAYAQSAIRSHDLLIAGDGPERKDLESLSAELALTGRAKFLGRADRAMTASLFKGCAIFVIPSRADEGLPVVIAEAMAAGKPIVGTRVGGVAEAVLDGQNGIVVPREDAGALSAALVKLCGDRASLQSYGEESSRRSALFGWKTIAGQYAEVYDAVSEQSQQI